MKNTNLTVLVILVSSLLFSTAFAETIVKDANGVEYLADQIILKVKTAPAKKPEKGITQSRQLMGLAEASSSIQSLAAKWAVTESKALFPQIGPPTAKMNLSAAAVKILSRKRWP